MWNCGIRLWTWVRSGELQTTLDLDGQTLESADQAVKLLMTQSTTASRVLAAAVGEWFYAGI